MALNHQNTFYLEKVKNSQVHLIDALMRKQNETHLQANEHSQHLYKINQHQIFPILLTKTINQST